MSEAVAMRRLRERWLAWPRWARAAAALALLWVLSGVYVIGGDQVAVLRAFGRVVRPSEPPGVGWHLPWPLGRVDRVRLHQPRQISIGTSVGDALVGRDAAPDEEHLTGDQNLVRVRATVQYTVRQPTEFLFSTADVDTVVAAAVQSELTAAVAGAAVDDLMTTGRETVRRAVLDGAQARLDRYGLGVGIDVLSIEQVRPPTEVAAAFNDVNSAKQDASRSVNEARGYANEVVPQARGEAAELGQQAAGYRARVVNEADGRAARFGDLESEYRRAPQVTRVRMHLETVERVAPRLNTMVVDGDGGRRPIDLGIVGTSGASAGAESGR